MRRFSRIAIVTSDTREAIEAGKRLAALYGDVDPVEADVIVALGGDGLMLQTLHRFMGTRQADLRDEPRLCRLPDERVPGRGGCSSGSKARSAASCIRC